MRCRAIAARQAKVLVPSTPGPGFTGDGKTARHQDVITIRNKRKMSGRYTRRRGSRTGSWKSFMTETWRWRAKKVPFSAPQLLLF
jgi:hypothetical protein